MSFYFKIARLVILLISFQESYQKSYQGPADYFALDRIVAIFGWGHKLPSCFGTFLTSSHVITSASCILRLSDAIAPKSMDLPHKITNGLQMVEIYPNLQK